MFAKFEKYDYENPEVYNMYKKYAREAITAGMRTLSISMLTERVRWESKISTTFSDGFKINNNFRSFYVRKLLSEKEFENRFVIKKSVADKEDFGNSCMDEYNYQ